MASETKIEWCDATFNPFVGCTKVSPGCDSCYAESWAKRSGLVTWGAGAPRVRTSAANWKKPLQWNAKPFYECSECGYRGEGLGGSGCPQCAAELSAARRRVFCASLADVFDNEVPQEWREDLFALIEKTPHLDWLLLTKRIGNARTMMPPDWIVDGVPRNVWLGATFVNQEEYDRDIGKLLRTPASVHFLSIEPMLGAIDMRMGGASVPDYAEHRPLAPLSWVIVGGESGPKARDFDIAWPRSIVSQCKAAGVPVFVKQMGARPVWSDTDDDSEPPHWGRIKYLDRAGGDWFEWPEDLRVRQFPETVQAGEDTEASA